ncbi:MAG: phosphoenolpyruvate carboxylase, partial [Legionellaceae bacterium]
MASLSKTKHVTQQIQPAGLPVLQAIFDVINSKSMSELKKTKVKIVEDIVRIDYIKYLERRSEPSHLFHLIDSIPHEWRFDEKINFLIHRLRLYPAIPVITAHPTRVVSHEAVCLLYDIVALLGSLDEGSDQKNTVALVTQKINYLIQHPLVPPKTLTPDEESKMALYIYQQILESFPGFFNDVVNHFVNVQGGDKANVALLLKAPIMASFQNVCSWVKGDGDGNPNVTAETMKHAIPAQQIALLEVYIRQINAIVALIHKTEQPDIGAALQAKRERFTRCIRDIKGRVWFDVVGSKEEKQSIFKVLDDLLEHTMPNSPVHHMTMNLRDLIELAGFYGGLKEFVRQTTTVHQHVWKNFSQILIQHHKDIAHLMLGRDYDALNDNEKTSLHDLLSTNTIYFETLHLHAGEFTPQTQDELRRLFLIRQNLDIFPSYIFSDTKGSINFSEARLAMHFAAHHFANSLKMRQVKEYPFNQLPLCETPEDLERFDVMLR